MRFGLLRSVSRMSVVFEKSHSEYRRDITEKLSKAISAVCERCEQPEVDRSTFNCTNPEACACHCDRIEGPLTALKAIRSDIKP